MTVGHATVEIKTVRKFSFMRSVLTILSLSFVGCLMSYGLLSFFNVIGG